MKRNISLKRLFEGSVFVFLLLINCWERVPVVGKMLSHGDEVFTLLLGLYILLNIQSISKHHPRLLIVWGAFWSIGAISSMLYHYQDMMGTLIDGIVIVNRFIFGYLAAAQYCRKIPVHKLIRNLLKISKIITIVFSLLLIHEILLPPFFGRGEYRYFMYSQKLFFSHPTYFAMAGATLLGLFTLDKSKYRIFYQIAASLFIFSTLRSKAIGFFFAFWLIYVYFFVLRKKNIMAILCAAAVGAVGLTADQFILYFATPGHFSPRLVMMTDAVKLAVKSFPFGTGFGTFGSTMAAQHYSRLYYLLGYTQLDGMGKNGSTTYLCDSFWPCIIGQFGFIGLILYIWVMYYFIKVCMRKSKQNRMTGFAMLTLLIYLLICSIAETSFFNPGAFLIGLLIGAIQIYHNPPNTVSCNRKIS